MQKHRTNEDIRAAKVRVIGDEEFQGVYTFADAYQMAMDAGVDLVEVAPNADPPVCKLMDYGKFLYEQAKKEKAAKAKQHTVTVKGVRLSPKISAHDLKTKAVQAMEFVKEGNKVKVFVIFRGRMITHKELGHGILVDFIELIKEVATVEQAPRMDSPRNMSMLLAPKKK
jgi:translation initiation factor IF-3